MVKYLAVVLLLLVGIQISAQEDSTFDCLIIDQKGTLREQFVDFERLKLRLSFDPKQAKVIGEAEYEFAPIRTQVDHLFLDAPNIDIQEVWLDSVDLNFEYLPGGINIDFQKELDWDKKYHLNIKYTTNPQKGIYFIGWNDETNRARKQIWTQGQGIDNRHWIPGFDAVNDKLITETIIEFENDFEVISNGVLLSKKRGEHNTTWHYAMKKPHSLYLVMLAIGKYEYKDYEAKSGIKSRQYYYPAKTDAVQTTYRYSNKMMNWFQQELGLPYQWEIYKNVPVQDFMYGAMENTSATIFTDYYLQNKREALERNYIATNAHELAHHWFGDLITEWSSKHHWLHESFATHYAKHFMRLVNGEDEFEWKKRQEQNVALSASLKNKLPIAHSDSGSSRHYSKGSFVIDMLRYVVGEPEYKKTITAFLKENKFDMVDTHDFQMAFIKHVGINLDWFFKQWVYKGGEPEYQINYKANKKNTYIEIAQIQEQNQLVGLFKMPITFQVFYKDGSFDEKTAWIENLKDTVIVDNKGQKELAFVIFDAGSRILKKIQYDRSYEELLLQAKLAPNMIDRFDAVKALSHFAIEQKRNDLIDLYLLNDFRAIKQNILKQFKNDENSKTSQLMVYAMSDKHALVRRAAIQNSNFSNKRYLSFYEELLEDPSYVNIEIVLKKLCEHYPENKHQYLEKTKDIDGKNFSLKLTWLNIAFAENKKLLGSMVDYASESFEFRTRIKAINLIRQNQYYNDIYCKHLINAYISFNRRLKKAAAGHLNELLAQKDSARKLSKYISGLKLFPHQQASLEKLLTKNKQTNKR